MKKTVESVQGIIEIRDPEIQVDRVVEEIRTNMAAHGRADPVGHEKMLAEERMGLRASMDQVRFKVGKYGDASSTKRGVARRAEILVKKAVRKVLQRHIDQQHDVNQSVLELMDKMTQYLDRQAKNQVELWERIARLEEKR